MDPIAELERDHRTVQGLLERYERGEIGPDANEIDEVVRELSMHAAAEELVFYPGVQQLVPGGENLSEQHRREHQLVKELLVGIERTSGEERKPLLDALLSYVRHHVRHEEEVMFPQLREHASAQQLNDMGQALADAKAAAPTHPHPHAPDKPPAVFPAAAAAALLDRVRDAISERRR